MPSNAGTGGRNTGVELAHTPFIAFCDDDMTWDAGSFEQAVRLMNEYPHTALLQARILVGARERLDPVCAEMAESPLEALLPSPGKAILGFLAGSVVIRREAFLEVGGFEERMFIGGEEALLAIDLESAGWALSYVEELVVRHAVSEVRDPAGRSWIMKRNALWTAMLRRPGRSVLRELWLLAGGWTSRSSRTALLEATKGLPWALRRRRAAPQFVEERLEVLKDFS